MARLLVWLVRGKLDSTTTRCQIGIHTKTQRWTIERTIRLDCSLRKVFCCREMALCSMRALIGSFKEKTRCFAMGRPRICLMSCKSSLITIQLRRKRSSQSRNKTAVALPRREIKCQRRSEGQKQRSKHLSLQRLQRVNLTLTKRHKSPTLFH